MVKQMKNQRTFTGMADSKQRSQMNDLKPDKIINTKQLVFVFIFCALQGCVEEAKQSGLQVIPINTENIITFPYNKYVTESSLLQLDAGERHYLGDIHNLTVKEGKIAINSNQKIYLYDENNGSLLSIIDRQGKGPGEYIGLSDFYIDNDAIYVLDGRNHKIFKYDLQGNFVEQMYHGLLGSAFIKTDPEHFAIYIMSDKNEISGSRLNIYSLATRGIIRRYFEITDEEYQWQYVLDQRNFITNQDTTYFTCSFNDTIYRVETNVLMPHYVVDLGRNRTPGKFKQARYDDIRDFSEKAARQGYIYSVGVHHAGSYIYLGFRYSGQFTHAIYSLKTGHSIVFDRIKDFLAISGFDEETSFDNFPITNDDEYFYVILQPGLILGKLKERRANCPDYLRPLLEADEMSNPFLLKFKIAGF